MNDNLRIRFLIATEGGLLTEYLNLKSGLTPDLGITPEWIIKTSWKEGGRIERLPLPSKVKAALRLRVDARDALTKGTFDGLFINNMLALYTMFGFGHLLRRHPYFIASDATIKQLYSFGTVYLQPPRRIAAYERFKHEGVAEMMRNAAALFPWSQWVAESMINDYGVDPSRVHVAVAGIDLNQWTVPPHDHSARPTNILFIGGAFARKGGDLLLNWARKTSARDWILHLVTRDPITPPNENVRVYNDLMPNSPALMELYRQAHFVVLPTLGDNYSLGAIEALASGLPSIQSRTGGTEDIIREGETGYLITPGDCGELSDRIEHLLAHPQAREAMGRAARQDAEARFDLRKNVPRMAAIMRRALDR